MKISYPLYTVIYNEAEELRGFFFLSNLHLVASVLATARTPTVSIKRDASGIISIKTTFTIIVICSCFLLWQRMKHGLD